MGVEVPVDRIWRWSLRRAARATASSASGWNAFWFPAGASTIGQESFVPRISVEVSMSRVSTRRRGRSWK
jgi:hypothetical protein